MAERQDGPLLFVASPPVHFISEPVYSRAVEELEEKAEEQGEESTSVYSLPKRPEETEKLLGQLRFLTRPFQREVYRPIQFRLKDGTSITGEIQDLADGRIAIKGTAEEELETELSIEELDGIWWKGKPLPDSN